MEKKTFSKIINLDMDYIARKYVDAYNKTQELIEDGDLKIAEIYLEILATYEQDLLKLMGLVFENERKTLERRIKEKKDGEKDV